MVNLHSKYQTILYKNQTIFYILIAFTVSLIVHLIWKFVFGDNPLYYWNGELMINTNDGYYFASGVQKELYGMHQPNPLVPSIFDRGLVFVTYLLAKILPISLDTLILYMPAFISSIIVIPIILIGKLYNKEFWGFLSAILASASWSYYNRTLVGYYDTDMFALTVPVFILYFMLKTLKSFQLKDMLFTAITISIYEFLYLPGRTVAYSMGIAFALYLLYLFYKDKNRDKSKILQFMSMLFVSLSKFYIPIFEETLLKIVILVVFYFIFTKKDFEKKILMAVSFALLFYFLISSEALITIWAKIIRYTETGVNSEGFHFFKVFQTISEANGIPMFPDGRGGSNVAYRVIGSVLGFLAFLVGYVLLVIKKREFIIALPLVAIGLFAHWGGLRFTVYAIPIAALSSIYLVIYLVDKFLDKKFRYIAIFTVFSALLYPNIKHTFHYNPGTVFTKNEVKDLVKLNEISEPKDYTLTWWDYGYPIWYYSDTISLIDGGKHNADNFIISKMFLSDSQKFLRNFAILSVETFDALAKAKKGYDSGALKMEDIPDNIKMKNSDGEEYIQNIYKGVIRVILREKQADQKDPDVFFQKLATDDIKLPEKKRDIFIYAPLKMSRIFLTVSQFGNVDLKRGKKIRNITFFPTYAFKQKGNIILFKNGIGFDLSRGELILNGGSKKVNLFIETRILSNGDIRIIPKKYHRNGDLVLYFNRNTRRFIIMDRITFNSNYVKMFLLGIYDKNLFDLVIKTPHSRVYRVK